MVFVKKFTKTRRTTKKKTVCIVDCAHGVRQTLLCTFELTMITCFMQKYEVNFRFKTYAISTN